jgi:hypothetical protein
MTFFTQFARRGRRRPLTPARRVRRRPTLEALETRSLLSTLTVTNLSDTGASGDGSLRGEIAAAANGDQIVFARSLDGQTITLNGDNGPLVLNKDLTIRGPGAARLTISGNNATGVFSIAAGATDTITGLTIADGNADGGGGGGIFNEGTLTLDDSTLSDNHADGASFGGGGIINFVGGAVTIDHSTLSGNHADGGGAGGGIFNILGGTVTIDGSTLFGNRAPGGAGGGIFNAGALTLNFSAVFDNSAAVGADLDNDNADGGTVTLNHSFVGVRADG